MSKAADIAAVIVARLATIRTAAGYATQAGATVYRGRRHVPEEAMPCLTLIEGDDNVIERNENQASIVLPFTIEGHIACDPDHPNDAAHRLIADIKRSVFGGDPRLGGLAKDTFYTGRIISPRVDGVTAVVVAVSLEVRMVETVDAP